LKTIAFSDIFVTPFSRKVYEDGNLQKLVDKRVSGCRAVVGADGRKLGHFGVAVSLFHSICSRQFCSPLIGFFRLVPGFVEVDYVVL